MTTYSKEYRSPIQKTYRLAVVPACGGMTSTYTAGVLHTLQHIFSKVDMAVGGSSGLHNAVSYVANDRHPDEFLRNIARGKFFSWARALTTGYPYDTQRAVAWHMDHLDMERLYTSHAKVYGAVFRLRDGQTLYEQVQPHNAAWLLRATLAYPWAAPYAERNGELFADGSLYDSFPIQAAIDLGATKVIAIDTRPPTHRDSTFNILTRRLIFPRYPAARKALQHRAEHYREVRERILHKKFSVPVYYIAPEKMAATTFTQDESLLARVFQQGIVDGGKHLLAVEAFAQS